MRHQTTTATSQPTAPAPAPGARPGPPLSGQRRPRPGDGQGPPGTVAEVPAAVEGVLRQYLAERAAQADGVSGRFAEEVAELVARFALGGGKRLRPRFLWCGWRAGGPGAAEERAVLRVGAALELLQVCALVHDDLMDAAPLRRAKPSVHVEFAARHRARRLRGAAEEFGAGAALLTGDLALVWAEDLWHEAGLTAAARRRAGALWRAMRTEMVAGQYLDLHGQAAGDFDPPQALRIAHLKAGLYTVQRPLGLGAAIAEDGRVRQPELRRAGRRAGVAFQLRDDLLDVFGDGSGTGKPTGADVRQGKPTYLMAVALQQARAGRRRTAERVLTRALGDRALGESGLERVRAVLVELGARAVVEQHIADLAAEALAAVDAAGLTESAARELTGLIRSVACPPAVAWAPGGARG
ncbi:polyprenyl synthetase family protein [Streptomyces sp. TRM70308]|uniref:polyprenyl synthetase family protein n=1 Tax=Streptomyces sp. TRM70308 TaxID=3131932 RepID=UPI003D00A8A6